MNCFGNVFNIVKPKSFYKTKGEENSVSEKTR